MPVNYMPGGFDMSGIADALASALHGQIGQYIGSPEKMNYSQYIDPVNPGQWKPGTPWFIQAFAGLSGEKPWSKPEFDENGNPLLPQTVYSKQNPGFGAVPTGNQSAAQLVERFLKEKQTSVPPLAPQQPTAPTGGALPGLSPFSPPQPFSMGPGFGASGVPAGGATQMGDPQQMMDVIMPILLQMLMQQETQAPRGVERHHEGSGAIGDLRSMISMDRGEVPAVLEAGEGVINKEAMKVIGPEVIDMLNQAFPRTGGKKSSPMGQVFDSGTGSVQQLPKWYQTFDPKSAELARAINDPNAPQDFNDYIAKFEPGYVVRGASDKSVKVQKHGMQNSGRGSPIDKRSEAIPLGVDPAKSSWILKGAPGSKLVPDMKGYYPVTSPDTHDPVEGIDEQGRVYQLYVGRPPAGARGGAIPASTPTKPAETPAKPATKSGTGIQKAGPAAPVFGSTPPSALGPEDTAGVPPAQSAGARTVPPSEVTFPGAMPNVNMAGLRDKDPYAAMQYLRNAASNTMFGGAGAQGPKQEDMFSKLMGQYSVASAIDMQKAQKDVEQANAMKIALENKDAPMRSKMLKLQMEQAGRQDQMEQYMFEQGWWKDERLQPQISKMLVDAAHQRYFDAYANYLNSKAGGLGSKDPNAVKVVQGYMSFLENDVKNADLIVKAKPGDKVAQTNLIRATLTYRMASDPSLAIRAMEDPKAVAMEFGKKGLFGGNKYTITPEQVSTIAQDVQGTSAYQLMQRLGGFTAPTPSLPGQSPEGIDVPPAAETAAPGQ